MKKLLALILLAFGCQAQASSIAETIALGNSLTEAVKTKSHIKLKSIENYAEVKKYLNEKKCPGFKYRAYTLEESKRFYLVASKGKAVIIGRHFVGEISNNNVDLSSLASSTNGCINLGVPRKDSAAMFVTHLKSEPNEFHVLESNLAAIALFVSTKGGLFSVSEGSITKVKD